VHKDIETKFYIIRVSSKEREELARNTTDRSRIKEKNLEELKHASESCRVVIKEKRFAPHIILVTFSQSTHKNIVI